MTAQGKGGQGKASVRSAAVVAWWWEPRWMLAVILLLALLLRFWNLGQPKMSADESLHYFPEMQQIHLLSFDRQRHHPTDLYHATSPNPIGHPLFAVQVVNLVLQFSGPTSSTASTVARGVMALAGVVMVGVIYLLGRDLFDRRCGLLAALLAALTPLAVRYNRTLYLDSIYALLVALMVWLLVRAFVTQRWWYFVLGGIVFGLAAATKTSAPFMVLFVAGYGAFGWWQARHAPHPSSSVSTRKERKDRKRSRRHAEAALPLWAKWLAVPVIAFVVFYIFVDPGAYIHAIRYPVDTSYQNRSALDYLVAVWNSRDWLWGVALYLWTPPLLLAALAGLIVLVRREWRQPTHVLALMLLWLLCLGPLIPLHLRGLSGEHGYISFVAPVALLASVALLELPRLWMSVALAIMLVVMLPATILFGHRLMLLPYNSYLNLVDSEASSWQLPALRLSTLRLTDLRFMARASGWLRL